MERPADVPVGGVQDSHTHTVRTPSDITFEACRGIRSRGGNQAIYAETDAATTAQCAARARSPCVGISSSLVPRTRNIAITEAATMKIAAAMNVQPYASVNCDGVTSALSVTAHGSRVHGGEHRQPDRSADLHRRVRHGGRDTGIVRGHPRQRQVLQRDEDESHANTEHHQRRGDLQEVRAVRRDPER